jgi:hypothetical protein
VLPIDRSTPSSTALGLGVGLAAAGALPLCSKPAIEIPVHPGCTQQPAHVHTPRPCSGSLPAALPAAAPRKEPLRELGARVAEIIDLGPVVLKIMTRSMLTAPYGVALYPGALHFRVPMDREAGTVAKDLLAARVRGDGVTFQS